MTDEQLQRIHDIEYSCDSRAELAERIVGLEDVCERAMRCIRHGSCDACAEIFAGCTLRSAMLELGMEVDG